MSEIGRLGGLGKRLLQVAAQRVIAAGEEVERRAETRQLSARGAAHRLDPAGRPPPATPRFADPAPVRPDPAPSRPAARPNRLDPSPDPFDAALARLRAERPAADPPPHSEAPPDDAR